MNRRSLISLTSLFGQKSGGGFPAICLQYHSFSQTVDRYHITPLVLKAHMEAIAARHNVRVTIDDARASIYEIAFPLLSEHTSKTTIFIDTSHIGVGPRWLSAVQIMEMAQSGISMQSHSHSHRDHLALSPRDIRDEGIQSKAILENITGAMVNQYAFPHGCYDSSVCDELAQIGFTDFFTSDYGIGFRRCHGYLIHKRIEIFRAESIPYFFRRDVILKRVLRRRLRTMWDALRRQFGLYQTG